MSNTCATYSAICDVCGFEYKNFELRKRWDGFMVCKEDWEPRHILDFYTTRNDVNLLPWTRPDNNDGLSWTSNILTAMNYSGTITENNYYIKDSIRGLVNYRITIIPSGTGTTTGDALDEQYTIPPIVVVTAGKAVWIDQNGVNLGVKPISVGSTTSSVPEYAATSNIITISGQYGY